MHIPYANALVSILRVHELKRVVLKAAEFHYLLSFFRLLVNFFAIF